MSATDFDNYSTPSRDHRLFDSLADLRRAYVSIFKDDTLFAQVDSKVKAQMSKIFPFPLQPARDEMHRMPPEIVDGDSLCVVNYRKNTAIDLAEAKRRMFAGMLSSNPMDDLAVRWGEVLGPSASAKACPMTEPLWIPNVDEAN
jgi:hypothetical protein